MTQREANADLLAEIRALRERLATLTRENVDLQGALTQAHAQLSEALDQQTATSEILRVISESQTDLQPVFEAIVRSAAQLCVATFATLHQFDGNMVTFAAHYGTTEQEIEATRRRFPLPAEPGTAVGRAILDRRTTHIHDIRSDQGYRISAGQTSSRTVLAVPLLREGTPVGAIGLWRREVQPFSEQQIQLVETFANQAVIAVENVRLFKKLEARNRDLTESLEQQTATSEILRVISRSPTDVQPVFDTIVESATRLCGAGVGHLHQFDGELVSLVAQYNSTPASDEVMRRFYPMRPSQGQVSGRAILSREVVQIPDVFTDPEYRSDVALALGWRSRIGVPLLREGRPIGVIVINRTDPGLFSDSHVALLKTFADQAVIAIENVRLFTELQEKNQALTAAHAQVSEALEQQTATSEILGVIASSPTDAQPVFDTIVRSAVLLCGAMYGSAVRFDGALMHLAAGYNYTPEVAKALHEAFPMRPSPRMMSGRAILSRAVVEVEDALEDPNYAEGIARAGGFRSMLAAPMLRDGRPIGAIVVNRGQPGRFSPTQIALLQTFADQAVIAIENVRLFTETKEALARQTATSDILRVISSSPTDVQPVFERICQSAVRLFDAYAGAIVRADGGQMRLAVVVSPNPEADERYRRLFPRPLDREFATGRAILERTVVHVPDIEQAMSERNRALGRDFGYRRMLVVPMLQRGEAIGALAVTGREPGRYSDQELDLLKTFADQAVIAIENVRLFTELQTSNRELTAALDQQTATSEILRVVSRSQTDVQPVFDAIVASAVRLLGAYSGGLIRLAGDQLELVAHTGTDEAGDAAVRATFPRSFQSERVHAQAIRDRVPLNVADAHTDPRVSDVVRASARARGYRSWVSVPLLRHDEELGTIAVTRREPGGFTNDEIALLQTFADQAVIAIENARLLTELQARTQELTRSVEQLTALGDVGRTLSSTLDLDTVLKTIVTRANQLAATDACSVFEYDEADEAFHLRATHNLDDEVVAVARRTPIRKGEGVQGRMAVTRQPVQIRDIGAEEAYYGGPLRDVLLRSGTRALLAIPMLREDQLIGGFTVAKKTPGEFSSEVIELLQTFAIQSALAIQNARLFREIEEKSRQLEVASQHKSEFLANMSHELRTPLNAIIGFSEVLTDRMFGELNEKQEEYLKDIYASGTHLLSLINDILDLSKIEAGRMELELTEFDLRTAIDNAVMLVRERAGRRNIALHTAMDPHLGQIQADERKVRQVVLNLLSNAIKFTPEGGRIEVSAIPRDGSVEVSVSDTGIGIGPEDQEKVFEEFRQVGTAAKKVEGTGLGLTLCRKFVELHGGKIWVKSELGQGSTFTFTIPVRRGD